MLNAAVPSDDPVLRALLDAAATGLIAVDGAAAVTVANAAAHELLGLDRVDPGIGVDELAHASSRLLPGDRPRLALLLRGASLEPLVLATADGLVVEACRQPQAGGAIIALTSRAAGQEQHVDPLTGLADRRRLQARLEFLCAENRPAAVLMLDLDRFKQVNDTLGHPAGDALLRLVAQRLRHTLRSADVLARVGGDEFAVVLEAGAHVPEIAARLISVLSRPYLVERQSAVIGVSVGIAYAPEHGTTPAALLRAADLALYLAKAEGKGVARVFTERLDQQARKRATLAEELRRALPLKQFTLFFQPQISLKDHTLIGFEALIRWNHPRLGLIGPDQFIPAAEESGLILPLGEWVLSEACRQAVAWPGDLVVAVNVSPKQLQDRNRLPREIAAALEQSGLPARRLEIEITETAIINETEALDVLARVRAMGVRISMDDFGTGYSSLSQLRSFPFDKLKIDRSFVRDLAGNADAVAVVRAVAALGQSLGMCTIAEGVETADQEVLCRDHGCNEMQGYLISQPVPSAQVDELIRRLA